MPNRILTHSVAVCVCLLALLTVYVGSYFALLVADEYPGYRLPRYRIANNAASVFFGPLHWLDKGIRPAYWGEAWISVY